MAPMLPLVDRYILKEVAAPFLLAIGALTLILFVDQSLRLTELFIVKGAPLSIVAQLFAALLPSFLVISLPVATLIGAIVAFSRLTSDNEVLAARALGIGHGRLLRPALLFAATVFAATLWLSVWAQPWAGRSLRQLAVDLVRTQLAVALEPGVFNMPFSQMTIYVERMPNPSTLEGVLIHDARDGDLPQVILARRGRVLTDPAAGLVGLRLEAGTQYRAQPGATRYQTIAFAEYELRLDVAGALASEIPATRPNANALRHALAHQGHDPRLARQLGEHYKNYAFPFACVLFGAIGAPLGTLVRRGGRMAGFALGVVTAVSYYVQIVVADFAIAAGTVAPLLGAWLPNLITGTAAVWLLRRTVQERPWRRQAAVRSTPR